MSLSTKFVNRNLTFSKESAELLDLLKRDGKRLGALSEDEVSDLKRDLKYYRDTGREDEKRHYAEKAYHHNLEGYKALQEMHLANDGEKGGHFGRAFYHFREARDYHDSLRKK